jgi:hypothetical protein
MKRRLFNAITVVSALLCVLATLPFFATISHSGYVVEFARGKKIQQLRLQQQQLLYYWYTIGDSIKPPEGFDSSWDAENPRDGFRLSLEEASFGTPPRARSSFQFCGCGISLNNFSLMPLRFNESWMVVPQWMLVASTMLLPLWWLTEKIRAARKDPGGRFAVFDD